MPTCTYAYEMPALPFHGRRHAVASQAQAHAHVSPPAMSASVRSWRRCLAGRVDRDKGRTLTQPVSSVQG
jgi:hypothetical protein